MVGGGWVVRKIENKDQLSPVEVEIRAELGKNIHAKKRRKPLVSSTLIFS